MDGHFGNPNYAAVESTKYVWLTLKDFLSKFPDSLIQIRVESFNSVIQKILREEYIVSSVRQKVRDILMQKGRDCGS